jgi:hypothetical protein
MRLSLRFLAIATLSLVITSNVQAAQTSEGLEKQAVAGPEFAKFKPDPKNSLQIDYTFWNDILNNMVFLTGLSTRQAAPKPEALTGSRFVWQHTSPLRQEGNKIPFSLLNKDHVTTLQDYKRDLEDLSNTTNIAALPRAEQLAYWYNLHNVTVITLIAENYPVVEPSKLLIGTEKMPLHDAKTMTVGGTKLSLRDIRENIVYPNWNDPRVVYGFFLGDIGSPAIQGEAFNTKNMDRLLNKNTEEFVNSLRSFSRGGVSKIYEDVSRFYFTNFEEDLRKHLRPLMWDDVKVELDKAGPLKINAYEYDIADMEGGHGPRVIANVSIDGQPVTDSQRFALARYTNEIKTKSDVLVKQGKIKRGQVTVGDEIEESKADEPQYRDAGNQPKGESN